VIDRRWGAQSLKGGLQSKTVRLCDLYEGLYRARALDQEFNSLDAQYEGPPPPISKARPMPAGTLIRSRYDDGGYSGGSTDRPDLQRLLEDIRAPQD